MSNLSVVDPPFLVGLGLTTLLAVTVSWFDLRRRWLRWTVRGLALGLALLMTAAGLNARYEYLPTVAAVFGRNATDQVSSSRLRGLELAAGNGRRALGLASGRPGRARPAVATLQRGVVVPFTIPATVSHFHARTGEVYLPPAYFESPHVQLPVIELLHGTPGSPADWTRGAFADTTADAYARTHQGVAPILVMPDVNGSWSADTECVNGKHGNAQTYLTVDVRNAVVRRFHARRAGRSWAIAGLSEGGLCALQIGLRHPSMFHVIGDFSGDERPSVPGGPQGLFAGSPAEAIRKVRRYDPTHILARWSGAVRPAIWFEVGTLDGNLPAMIHLDLLARADGFTTRFVAQPNETHGFAAWSAALSDSFPWLADSLATTAPAATVGQA